MNEVVIYCDGGSRGNPGEAAYGFVVFNVHKEQIYSEGKRVGINTNNYAEYSAVVNALKYVSTLEKKPSTINFFLDSMLVVEQLSGKWKVKSESLRDLYHTVKTLEMSLKAKIKYQHVPREQNKEADRMVNLALDNLI